MSDDALSLQIERHIFLIRGQKVMLDADLAELYGVETGALNRAVKRNSDRLPADFMFQLTAGEVENLKCQFGISSSAKAPESTAGAGVVSQVVIPGSYGGRRSLPYAFTEQGVAMLSSVLRSPRAVQVNVAIMRAFVRLRELLLSNVALARKLADLEGKYDAQFKVIFDAIRQLMTPPEKPKRRIGFQLSPAGEK